MTTVNVNTTELIGPSLDWAVEEALGYGNRYLEFWNIGGDKRFIYCQVGHSPSTSWDQGGPIIDREYIGVYPSQSISGTWASRPNHAMYFNQAHSYGPTPLIAAMRCFVTSKLGETVNVPVELTNQ